MLVSVPLTLRYLGPERYGLWMAITSFLTLINFSDLGIGLALTRVLADADGRADRDAARRAVSNSMAMLAAATLLILLCFSVVYPLVPWPRLFNVNDPIASREAGPATAAVILGMAISFPLSVIGRVQVGQQDGARASVYHMLGATFALLATVVAVATEAGLPQLVLMVATAPLVAAVLNSLINFSGRYRWLRPRFADLDRRTMQGLLATGGALLALQVGYALSSNADSFIVARILGAGAVADYSVPARLFSLVTVLVGIIAAPLFPAFAEAAARGDTSWLRLTARRLFYAGLIAAVLPAMLLWAFGQQIIAGWVGRSVDPSKELLLAFALWVIVDSVRITLTTLLAATSRFRLQLVAFAVYVPCGIVVRVAAATTFGVVGMVTAHLLCFSLCVAIPFIWHCRSILRSPPSHQTAVRSACA
jgi:O-antigen/teichoic acid export membrane protein